MGGTDKKLNKQIVIKAKCHEGNKEGGKLERTWGSRNFDEINFYKEYIVIRTNEHIAD